MIGSRSYPDSPGETRGPPPTRRPVHVLLNPASGNGRAVARWRRLEPLARAVCGHLSVQVTAGLDEAAAGARDLADRAVVVVAGGGDGTAHAVLNGLLDGEQEAPRATLAWLPLGSGNDLARAVGIPADPRAAVRLLENGGYRAIDVGVVRWSGPGGTAQRRFFGSSLTFGLSTRVLELAAGARRGRLGYAALAARAILEGHAYPVAVTTPGGATVHRGSSLLAAFSNTGRFGAGMRIAPGARIDDGVLDLVVVGPLGRAAALAAFPSLLRGRHLAHPAVTHHHVTEAVVDAPAFAVEIDGELLRLPKGQLEIGVRHRALRVLGPGNG